MAGDSAGTCSCKVGRVAHRHGLGELDAELRRRREEGASLRALAAHVNRRVLAAALDAGPEDGVYGAVSDEEAVGLVYDALAGDDAAPERTARVRTRLEQRGVDVDAVTDDWVTHPTVRGHLRECLGLDTSRGASVSHDDAVDTIEWVRARSERVVGRTFERLDDAGLVTAGDLDVATTFRLTCADCGETYRPGRLLDRGACACEPADEAE